ncbi:hypothetical protein KAR91_33385 [Candidatus Pacearchaeota archaeon]|nr:hypothetical protein [Candidatus Pacearchaeota archaeon]
MNTQLPLGVHPLTIPVREGLKVAFLLWEKRGKGPSRSGYKHTVVKYGTIVSCLNGSVVVEDITAPGSRHNRDREQVYEAHVEGQIIDWER